MFSSLEFFGENENYTFLESLESCESENQCWHFFQAPLGLHLGFSKWRLFFLKNAYILGCNHRINIFWCLNIHFGGQGIEWDDLECC